MWNNENKKSWARNLLRVKLSNFPLSSLCFCSELCQIPVLSMLITLHCAVLIVDQPFACPTPKIICVLHLFQYTISSQLIQS